MPRPAKQDFPKPVTPEQIGAMAQSGATDEEIATYYGLRVAALRRRYKKDLAFGRAARRIRIRQAQMKAATEGSATMLIFLGKAELGQGEAPTQADDVRVMRRAVERGRPGDAERRKP